MDLRGYENFVVDWNVGSTDMTLTFKDSTETTEIGTITIQRSRILSFLNDLSEVAGMYEPPVNDTISRDFATTVFKDNKSRTSW